MDKTEVLRKSDVFHYLEDADLKEIEKMCSVEIFDGGTTIFKQNRELEKLYVIQEGCVAIQLELSPTDRRQMQSAGEFECVGWEATIPPFRAMTTAQALERTTALAFNGRALRNLYFTNPSLCCACAGGVAYVISQRLKAAFSQLMGIAHEY
jgi:CRP-like cAMP-binding protein